MYEHDYYAGRVTVDSYHLAAPHSSSAQTSGCGCHCGCSRLPPGTGMDMINQRNACELHSQLKDKNESTLLYFDRHLPGLSSQFLGHFSRPQDAPGQWTLRQMVCLQRTPASLSRPSQAPPPELSKQTVGKRYHTAASLVHIHVSIMDWATHLCIITASYEELSMIEM